MPDSRRLATTKALATRLRAMSGGSYHYPIAADKQVTLDVTVNPLTVDNVHDLPLYVLEPTPDGRRDFSPGAQVTERFVVNVIGRMDADEADPASRATVFEGMVADLERAIASDVTFGGLSYDCRMGVPAMFAGIGTKIVVVTVPLEFRFYRTYGTPE